MTDVISRFISRRHLFGILLWVGMHTTLWAATDSKMFLGDIDAAMSLVGIAALQGLIGAGAYIMDGA